MNWILAAVSAALFLAPRVGPKMWTWATSNSASLEELTIAELRAVHTLKARAKRRNAAELTAAVEQVEENFMKGDDPL